MADSECEMDWASLIQARLDSNSRLASVCHMISGAGASPPSSILIIGERVEPQHGGLAVATSRIARHAAATGYAVHLVHPSREVSPGARGRRSNDGVVYHPVGVPGSSESDLMLLHQHARSLAERENAEIIHGIYATRAGWIATLIGLELKLPSVVSLRGNDLDRGIFRADELPFLRGAIEQATVVTGVSRALCQRARAVFGRDTVHVTNSVDAEAFQRVAPSPELREALRLGSSTVIGFLGEMREKKGMPFLLPAVDALSLRRDVVLLLIGGVREEARSAFDHFRKIAPDAAARIRIVEYARDPRRLSELLALCDLMVFPSLFDGTPNALLEAMAAGKPILATDAGGQRDLIKHGENGALLPVGRLGELVDAIEEMLGLSVAERERMGSAARAYVIEHHGIEAERRAYGEIYAKLIGRRGAEAKQILIQ